MRVVSRWLVMPIAATSAPARRRSAMTTNKRRYWGIGPGNLPAAAVPAEARMQEDAGLDGLFAVQVYGTPFVPLAAAATATSRIRLASGIALAFTRSPYETALHAMDLDQMSGGRLTLGLCCIVVP